MYRWQVSKVQSHLYGGRPNYRVDSIFGYYHYYSALCHEPLCVEMFGINIDVLYYSETGVLTLTHNLGVLLKCYSHGISIL